MNPDTIGCVWTGEFDLNTLRVAGEIFESGKKKLRIKKYPDTCGRGLSSAPSCHTLKDIKSRKQATIKTNWQRAQEWHVNEKTSTFMISLQLLVFWFLVLFYTVNDCMP